MRLVLATCATCLLAPLFGCTESAVPVTPKDLGDDGSAAAPADLAMPDLATPDLVVLPDLTLLDLTEPLYIGKDCPNGDECGMNQICLGPKLGKNLPPGGYCTKPCMNDIDCGAGAFCGPDIPGTGHLCFALCDANDKCAAANRVCSRRLAGQLDLVRPACIPGNANAKDGAPCKTWGDCNRNQFCSSNPFEAPGGSCLTVGCTLGNNATCSPAPGNAAQCLKADNVNICVATCMVTNDCRANEGYTCFPLAMTNLCVFFHISPGSSCMNDAACGKPPWKCLAGGSFPGGYCSGPLGTCNASDPATCPDGSHCYDPTPMMAGNGDQYCAVGCSVQNECRVQDGYDCLPVDAQNKGCRLP